MTKSDGMLLFVQVVAFELDIGYSHFKRFSRPVLDQRPFMRMVLFDIKVGKKDNSCKKSLE